MKTLIIIFLLFLGTVMPHTIVLDGQNPFIIQKSKNTSSASSTTTNIDLIMNISFPYGSKGLQYKQYIALRFPQLATGINGNQALNSANSANDSYQCLLTNKDSNTSILLTYVKTPYFQGESNTIFCMLSDTSKEAPLKSNVNYQFMIRRQSSSNDLSTNFMNNFNLFTLTNNND